MSELSAAAFSHSFLALTGETAPPRCLTYTSCFSPTSQSNPSCNLRIRPLFLIEDKCLF